MERLHQAVVAALGEIGDITAYDYIYNNVDDFSILTRNIALISLDKIKSRLSGR